MAATNELFQDGEHLLTTALKWARRGARLDYSLRAALGLRILEDQTLEDITSLFKESTGSDEELLKQAGTYLEDVRTLLSEIEKFILAYQPGVTFAHDTLNGVVKRVEYRKSQLENQQTTQGNGGYA